MWRDIRHAVRALAHAPGFTFTATLALALAIGANGAIFGLVDALWLRPPGVRDPGTLVRVFVTADTQADAAWSWPELGDIAGLSAFEQVAARGRRGAVLTARDGSQDLVLVNVVSPNFFEMLGVRPAAGRLFRTAAPRVRPAPSSATPSGSRASAPTPRSSAARCRSGGGTRRRSRSSASCRPPSATSKRPPTATSGSRRQRGA